MKFTEKNWWLQIWKITSYLASAFLLLIQYYSSYMSSVEFRVAQSRLKEYGEMDFYEAQNDELQRRKMLSPLLYLSITLQQLPQV